MEIGTEFIERQEQVADLHQPCFNRYVQLESKYDTQKKEMIEYKSKANYWEAQFNQLKSREELLKSEVEDLKAQLRKREQQLFGKKSEKGNKNQDQLGLTSQQEKNKKKRGQQVGSEGHGRRDYSHLPVVKETVE